MIYAVLGALAVGLSLGLLGSGGSILTLPALVYLLHQPTKEAIAGSLVIVGAIALVGATHYAWQRLVSWRHVLLFGAPGVIATYGGAWVSQFASGVVQLIVFAVIMGLAAVLMLKPPRLTDDAHGERAIPWLIVAGVGVGLLTGFVGVGGGFLLVPALVLLGGLRMHRAVATSLAVIVINSISGFYKHHELLAGAGQTLDWHVIGLFVLIGTAGSVAGNIVARRVPHHRLRQVFGVFLILMCGFILWRSIPELLHTASVHSA
ncbi:MAG: sulfite exporter TauE/SafE family protein [Gammaproteobacteria bacterium]